MSKPGSDPTPNLKDFLPLLKHAGQDIKNNAFQEAFLLIVCGLFYGALRGADPDYFSHKGVTDFIVICIFGFVLLAFFVYCTYIQIFKRGIKK